MTLPLQPIQQHLHYACSWVVSHAGLDLLEQVAETAAGLNIDLRVRQMFQHEGLLIYPFAVFVPTEETLKVFQAEIATAAGMTDWYIVNADYFERAIPFAENYRTAMIQIPHWLVTVRKYADYNAEALSRLQADPSYKNTSSEA